jgi:RNA polymerase sigma-70 factor (ECF subfamily)
MAGGWFGFPAPSGNISGLCPDQLGEPGLDFPRGGNPAPASPRLKGDGMSRPASKPGARPTRDMAIDVATTPLDELLDGVNDRESGLANSRENRPTDRGSTEPAAFNAPASPRSGSPDADGTPLMAFSSSTDRAQEKGPAKGCQENWGEILLRTFNEVRDELLSTLWFVLGDQDDAQDIAQEVFLRCWRTQDGLPEVQNLRAWIFRVGLNAARDLQRSAWRRRVKPLLGAELMPRTETSTPGQDMEDREEKDRLRQALMHLRPEEKEVFLLRQNGELTYEQIAALYERPVGTVKTQMRSALQKLRKVLTC